MSAVSMKVNEILTSGAELKSVCVMFLKTDLDIGLTFSAIALDSADPVKRERNRQRALNAYRTVDRLSARVVLSDDDARIVSRKLERLRLELLQLEEVL